MLTALFAVAALIVVASLIRRPRRLWERVAVALAGVLMLAVLVAWGIEYIAQRA